MKKILTLTTLGLALAMGISSVGRDAGMNTVAAAADAKAIYDQKCSKCHGADGKGIPSLQPPDFTDAKWQASRTNAQFTASLNNGKGTMPGFKGAIAPADMKALITMVRGFAPKPGAAKKK